MRAPSAVIANPIPSIKILGSLVSVFVMFSFVMLNLDLLSTILYHYIIISVRLIYMSVFNGSKYHIKPCNVENSENGTPSGENDESKIRDHSPLDLKSA
jgi:hypothetical protein